MPAGTSAQPVASVFDETEQYFRDNPSEDFQFMPVAYNAHMRGRLECFKHVADLPKEAPDTGINSWQGVIWKDRRCPRWSKWEPGISPREHLAEGRSRKFTKRLNRIALVVSLVAAIVTVVLLTTPDAVGCQTVKNVAGWFHALSWLSCR
jgi:hypothetical protein